MSVYVEIDIAAPVDAVWAHTQQPDLHQRWDLRFTCIEALPRGDAEPQRFRYTTRLGFGLAISGDGEFVAQRDLPDGSRASSLQFGSSHPLSIIRLGSGYWKYSPTTDGTRFVTSYDYETRFGLPGTVFDRLAFRPLIGWATAWSFDRLRLWLENGIEPGQALRQALVHGVARAGLAGIFLYHGLVPKLLGPDPHELRLLEAAGVPAALVEPTVMALGIAEILLAICLLAFWRSPWLAAFCAVFAVLSTLVVAIASPGDLAAAFNPVSLNIGVASLALSDLLALRDLPSAARCRRRPGGSAG